MSNQEENSIAKTFRILGWVVIICGFLAGVIASSQTVEVRGHYRVETQTVFVWSTALIYWGSSFISGMFYFGFAEIISLLQKLVDKAYAAPVVTPAAGSAAVKTAAAEDAKPTPAEVNTATVSNTPKPAAEKQWIDTSNGNLNEVLNALHTCEKYSQILELWEQNGLDQVEALAEYTKMIKNKNQIERMYGADKTRVKEFAENFAANIRSKG